MPTTGGMTSGRVRAVRRNGERPTNLPQPVEPRRVDKPWGHELIWAHSESYCGKLLRVEAGEQLSLQYHEEKDETLYLLSGVADLTTSDAHGELNVERIDQGWAARFVPMTLHRLRAVEPCVFLEVSTPHLDDVVRVEDGYGR